MSRIKATLEDLAAGRCLVVLHGWGATAAVAAYGDEHTRGDVDGPGNLIVRNGADEVVAIYSQGTYAASIADPAQYRALGGQPLARGVQDRARALLAERDA